MRGHIKGCRRLVRIFSARNVFWDCKRFLHQDCQIESNPTFSLRTIIVKWISRIGRSFDARNRAQIFIDCA